LSGNEHLGSLVSWLGVERVAEVHCGFFLRSDPLDWVLGEGKSIGRLASNGSWESGLSGASSDLKIRKEETHLKKGID